MLKGISMAAKAMKNQTVRNDVISNNLANTNTAGFKRDVSVFSDEGSEGGRSDTGVFIATSHVQGPLIRTDRPLDMAIQGEGFFVLETDGGEGYTRRGSFVQDVDGYLVDQDGHRVASSSGSLQLPSGEIQVSREGIIQVNDVEVGRLRIVQFDSQALLEKDGSSIFIAPDGVSPEDIPDEQTNIISGFLEESNVQVVREMTEMISALKAYEIAQKALKSQDEILHLMTGTVGKVATSA